MTQSSVHPDPAFPALHGRPFAGWVNDPNGCALVDGRYHLFFQHNPESSEHGDIVWGHVSSTDLITWRAEPVALRPRAGEPDEGGCWSGCVTVDDGVPTAVYSGVVALGGIASALLARSSADLRTWTQGRTPAAPPPDDPRIEELRDPFVVEIEGRRCVLQGGGRIGGPPQLLLYDATDLTAWRPLGVLLDGGDPEVVALAPADLWECPNLVRLDGRWVLLVSLWAHRGPTVSPLLGVRCLMGDIVVDGGRPRFVPESATDVDLGDCFYAPQLLITSDRVLLWGWAKEEARSAADVEAAGWAGSLTFPRELAVRDGALVVRLVPELTRLRAGTAVPVAVSGELPGLAFEVEVAPRSGHVELVIVHRDGETVVVSWDTGEHPTRVLVDGSMVEIEDGRLVPTTTRAYPTAGSRWMLRGAAGRAWVWRLRLPG